MEYKNCPIAHLKFCLGMTFLMYSKKLKANHKRNILRYKRNLESF